MALCSSASLKLPSLPCCMFQPSDFQKSIDPTSSNLLACCSCDIMYGVNNYLQYSIIRKPLSRTGRTLSTIAGGFPCEENSLSKQPRRSGLVLDLNLPICYNEGRQAWCLCSKTQVSIKYNHEKREQPPFRDESCCWDLNFSWAGGWLNKGRLFLWMGFMVGFVSLTQALTDITVTLVLPQLLNMTKTVYDRCVC